MNNVKTCFWAAIFVTFMCWVTRSEFSCGRTVLHFVVVVAIFRSLRKSAYQHMMSRSSYLQLLKWVMSILFNIAPLNNRWWWSINYQKLFLHLVNRWCHHRSLRVQIWILSSQRSRLMKTLDCNAETLGHDQ